MILSDEKQLGSAIQTYPASGAMVLLPLTPSTNYTATILMCGGQNINNWTLSPGFMNQVVSTDCVRITPDEGGGWSEDAGLPEGRTMGDLILLPVGKMFLLNVAQQGLIFFFHFFDVV